jgi:hypothetical protein
MKTKWLPIETAPDDRTVIIALNKNGYTKESFYLDINYVHNLPMNIQNYIFAFKIANPVGEFPTIEIHQKSNNYRNIGPPYCKWNQTETDYEFNCETLPKDHDITPDKYKYCPMCGKKIKWSEND